MLEKTGVFIKERPTTFSNVDLFPWIDISIVRTENGNFCAVDEEEPELANLIAVVTSKRTDQQIYLVVLTKIAEELNWELILEEDEDGNEEVVIWSPSENGMQGLMPI